jgi:hypothetical protein
MPDNPDIGKPDLLETELLGGEPIGANVRNMLRGLGLPDAALSDTFLSLTLARFFRDAAGCARFSPGPDDGRGPWRWTVQAGLLDEDGFLGNVAGFDLRRPDIWGMRERCAIAGHIGGRASDDPVPVHRNPLEWIAAGGDGILIANPSCAWRHIRDVPLVVKSGDVVFAKRLRAMRRPPKCDTPLYVEGVAA